MSHVGGAPSYRSGKISVSPSSSAPPEVRGAALEFLNGLAAELSKGLVDLPCFPNVVVRIRKALADPGTRAEQIVKIVGAEPRLAAKLLQTANSAAFNSSGRPLTELRAAITRLGQQLVQSAAMAFAVQQMKAEASLRSIAPRLSQLWNECLAVAAIGHVVAKRTRVSPDEAFLTGMLHGIGRLYVMVRSVDQAKALNGDPAFLHLVGGWQASIGKAILQNWGFAEATCEAVGSQADHERRPKHDPDLTDVLTVSIALGLARRNPAFVSIAVNEIQGFESIGLTDQECEVILTHAEHQLGALHDTLGC